MANFVINQTASEIQQILNKAETPDTTPTPNSQNLVESGGVKTYVDTQVSAGASITTNSFAPSALEDSSDGLSDTDTAIPTCAAVTDFVRSNFTLKAPENIGTVSTSSTTTTISGNTPHDGTIVISYSDARSKSGRNDPQDVLVRLVAVVDGVTYKSQGYDGVVTIPARNGASFNITLSLIRDANYTPLTVVRKFIPFNES
jgi:hypothetical protein